MEEVAREGLEDSRGDECLRDRMVRGVVNNMIRSKRVRGRLRPGMGSVTM